MKEKACGAVIYKYEEDELKFLLIKQTNDVWGFSKGHVEENEEEVETALREIKEETNLDVEINSEYRNSIEYIIDGKNILKQVVYFLATPKTTDVKKQESEIVDIKWLNFEDSLNTLTYDNVKEVLKDAKSFIEKI